MRNRVLASAALAAATLFAAACDGGSATAPRDGHLTRAEALALTHSMFGVGSSFAGGGVPTGARGARILAANGSSTFTFSFDTSAPCPSGGSVGLKGSLGGGFDAVASAGEVSANVTVAHAACKVTTDQGAVFTLNGDPDIIVGLNAASGPNGLTAFHLTETGAFTWDRGDGNSGRCTLDVAANLVAGTQNVQLSGSFCGYPVDGTIEHVGS